MEEYYDLHHAIPCQEQDSFQEVTTVPGEHMTPMNTAWGMNYHLQLVVEADFFLLSSARAIKRY